MAGKTIKYADGTVRTGKYNHYCYERFDRNGDLLWIAEELQPTAGQQNKHFYRKAWIVQHVETPETLELWSYNTLVMKFDRITGKFSYLDGFAPFGSYRSIYMERRNHAARYNSVTTRLHEQAFMAACARKYDGTVPTSCEYMTDYNTFSTYAQPHYIHVELSADGYAI